MNKISRLIITKRVVILALLGAEVYYVAHFLNVNIWYIVLFGIATGVIFGKVFCRWMCPIGFVMEMLMGSNSKFASMYQYNKMGCPIAWVSGVLNRWSLFRIKVNADTCIKCGKCDKQCYISTLEPAKFSIYKPDKQKSGDSYSCSKCLKCVAACPNGSLRYKI